MNQILRDREITVNQFIESQENDTDISSSQRKFLQINGVKCVKVKRRKNGLVSTNFLPVLSWALCKAAAWSLHFDLQHFHHSARQIIKRLKRDFFIMNENKLLAEIKFCNNCQISTIKTRRKEKFAKQILPNGPRISFLFDITGSLQEEKMTKFKFYIS